MNKSMLNNFLLLIAGATIGSAVTWKLVKNKYEQIAREEIDSVKEVFSKRESSEPSVSISKETAELGKAMADGFEAGVNNTEDLTHVKALMQAARYTSYSDKDKKEEKGEEPLAIEPYIIPPEELGECDYEVVSLMFYADGVLTDEMDEVIETDDEIDDIVGLDSLNHFGEYEDDSVFVRNDELQTDYEILRDVRRYADI